MWYQIAFGNLSDSILKLSGFDFGPIFLSKWLKFSNWKWGWKHSRTKLAIQWPSGTWLHRFWNHFWPSLEHFSKEVKPWKPLNNIEKQMVFHCFWKFDISTKNTFCIFFRKHFYIPSFFHFSYWLWITFWVHFGSPGNTFAYDFGVCFRGPFRKPYKKKNSLKNKPVLACEREARLSKGVVQSLLWKFLSILVAFSVKKGFKNNPKNKKSEKIPKW